MAPVSPSCAGPDNEVESYWLRCHFARGEVAEAGKLDRGAAEGSSFETRFSAGNSGSRNDLLAWSATLGEPVAGVLISNELAEPGISTLVRVTTEDRPGLLAALTQHLRAQELNVVSATVRTQGSLAVDTFIVSRAGVQGGPVPPEDAAALRASLEALLSVTSPAHCEGTFTETAQGPPWRAPRTPQPRPAAEDDATHGGSSLAWLIRGARLAMKGLRMAAPPAPPSPLVTVLAPALPALAQSPHSPLLVGRPLSSPTPVYPTPQPPGVPVRRAMAAAAIAARRPRLVVAFNLAAVVPRPTDESTYETNDE